MTTQEDICYARTVTLGNDSLNWHPHEDQEDSLVGYVAV
jgi:hypothetical protein